MLLRCVIHQENIAVLVVTPTLNLTLTQALTGADPGFYVRGAQLKKNVNLLEAGVGGPGAEPPAAGGKG